MDTKRSFWPKLSLFEIYNLSLSLACILIMGFKEQRLLQTPGANLLPYQDGIRSLPASIGLLFNIATGVFSLIIPAIIAGVVFAFVQRATKEKSLSNCAFSAVYTILILLMLISGSENARGADLHK